MEPTFQYLGLWLSWESASFASRRSAVRIRLAPYDSMFNCEQLSESVSKSASRRPFYPRRKGEMQNTPPSFTKSDSEIDVTRLSRCADGWLMSGDIDQHSQRTLGARRDIVNKLLWFLKAKNLTTCGTHELRQYFHYVTHGHKEPGGRWGNSRMTKPVRPRTVHTYHGHLRTLFRWIVTEGDLAVSPMDRIPVPTSRADQIQPFTSEQVNNLLTAADSRTANDRLSATSITESHQVCCENTGLATERYLRDYLFQLLQLRLHFGDLRMVCVVCSFQCSDFRFLLLDLFVRSLCLV